MDKQLLTEKEKNLAGQIVWVALKAAAGNKPYRPAVPATPIFSAKMGVFVSLYQNGRLRGCIGNFAPAVGLAQNLADMARAAALDDPRFLPLTATELRDLEVEISVLSPLQKIIDPKLIKVGKHGVYVRQGGHSGVYLPQVATEAGWNRKEFLNSVCRDKAGLAADAWRGGSIDIFIFTAQIFSATPPAEK